MALFAQKLRVHYLNAGAGKVGGIAHLGFKAESVLKPSTGGNGLLSAVLIDPHMPQLVTQHFGAGLFAEGCNFVKIMGCNVRFCTDPATAYGVDKGGGDNLTAIFCVYAAGGDKLYGAEGTGQRLHGIQAAIDSGREELHHIQPQLHGRHDLAGRHAAGRNGNVVLHTPSHDLGIKAGAYNKLCAAGHGLFALLQRHNGAGAHGHLRAVFRHQRNGLRRTRRAEGDLHHARAAGKKRLGRGKRVVGILQNHHGDQAGRCQFILNFLTHRLTSPVPSAVCRTAESVC